MTERDYTEIGDINALINALALMPFAVRVPQSVPVRLGDRIPAQRRPEDGMPWSMVRAMEQARPIKTSVPRGGSPPGVPARPKTTWGHRS